MKLILVVVVAIVGMLAQPTAQGNPDKNLDGFIDKDEAAALLGDKSDKCWKRMLTLADRDGDNKLTMQELQAAAAGGPPKECNIAGGEDAGVDEPAPEPNNNNPDKNNDGFIDKDEAAAMLGDKSDKCWKGMLTWADRDGDNKLSMAELMAAIPGGPPKECNIAGGEDAGVDEPAPEPNNNNPDKNNDGFIDKDEAEALFGRPTSPLPDKCWKGMLTLADTDGDNKLSMQEIQAASAGAPPKECEEYKTNARNTGGGASRSNGDGSNTGPNGPCKCTCLPGKNSYTCTCACKDI